MGKHSEAIHTSRQAAVAPQSSVAAPQPAAPAPVRVRCNLTMNEMLYDKYAEQAIEHGRASAEEEIMERLTRFQDFTDITYLVFDAQQKAELERAMGRATISPDIVLAQLKNAVTLQVGEVIVELAPKLQQRLRSRIFRG